jgi:hypothetical protein
VRGIGTWTAEMFLLFQLRRLDVWPVGDLGVRRGYGLAWQIPEPTARELRAGKRAGGNAGGCPGPPTRPRCPDGTGSSVLPGRAPPVGGLQQRVE